MVGERTDTTRVKPSSLGATAHTQKITVGENNHAIQQHENQRPSRSRVRRAAGREKAGGDRRRRRGVGGVLVGE